MDPPDRPHVIQDECESAARRSAFYHQNPFPPMLPTGDKSGWYSDYSSRGGNLRKWELEVYTE